MLKGLKASLRIEGKIRIVNVIYFLYIVCIFLINFLILFFYLAVIDANGFLLIDKDRCPVLVQTGNGVKVNVQVSEVDIDIHAARLFRFGANLLKDFNELKIFFGFPNIKENEVLDENLDLVKVIIN